MDRLPSELFTLKTGRRLLAVPAVGLGLYAEQLTANVRATGVSVAGAAPPQISWVLFSVAAVLFAAAAWPGRALRDGTPPLFRTAWRSMEHPRRFFLPLAGALVCALLAAPMFVALNSTAEGAAPPEPANTIAWPLWIASLLLFGVAFVVWELSTTPPDEGNLPDPQGDRLPRQIEWALMAGLMALGLAFRLPNLETAPPGLWFDEAQNGIVAQGLLMPGALHPTFLTGLTQMGALPFYFLGVVLKVFGTTVWPLRLMPALAGGLVVPMLYLLAARLYGWRAGLAAAGLLAVSAWNITFSRFGIISLVTVAADVAVYLCAAQALRTGRLGYYAGAGVLLGLSLQTYYVSRLVPLVLGALLIHGLIATRGRLLRQIRVGFIVLAVGGLLAFLPVGLFGLQQPAAFTGRVSEVSVFNPDSNGGDPDALNHSLTKHLLMFNFVGDRNGRHNLPGAPMLDDVTAALFILGLGACALRAWRRQYFFPVAWFVAALSGGVLSLPFEAPQSHRTLENSVVTALIAGIVVGELWGLLSRLGTTEQTEPEPVAPAVPLTEQAPRPKPAKLRTNLPTRKRSAGVAAAAVVEAPISAVGEGVTVRPVVSAERVRPSAGRVLRWIVSAAGVLAVVWWAGSISVPRYFNDQMASRGVWEEMYSGQAEAARLLLRYAASDQVYLANIYQGTPPMSYLAPGLAGTEWAGMDALPLLDSGGRNVTLVLDYTRMADSAAIPRLYPHATISSYGPPSDPSNPLLYTIHIPAADIATLHGVRATVYDTGKTQPREDASRADFGFDWAGKQPGTLRLATTIQISGYGAYKLDWHPAGAPISDSLRVDGYPVQPGGSMSLTTGLHSIVATDTVRTAAGVSSLQWTLPSGQAGPLPLERLFDPRRVEPHGLTGLYRDGRSGEGLVATARVDRVVAFYFQTPPLNRPYHVVWSGRLYVPQAGTYGLSTEQITESHLFLDGEVIISNTGPNQPVEAQRSLSAGWHDIRVEYLDAENFSHIYLYWTPPGRDQSVIPSAFLWPALGQYPSLPESGAWPTLDEAQSRWTPSTPPVAAQSGPTPASGPPTGPPVAPPTTAAQAPAAPTVAGTILQPQILLGEAGGTPLPHPRGAGIDAAGNLYIYTEGDSKVHKFGPDGKPLTAWDVLDKDGKPLLEGSALLVQKDRLYVLDAAAAELIAYDLSGKSDERTHICDCFSPRAIAPAKDGNFWVADTGNNRVVKVNPQGQTVVSFGGKGDARGQFFEPAGIWEAPDGTLYVADNTNGRVQSLRADGTPIAAWPVGPSVPRDGNRVTGESDGTALVTESAANAVVAYNAQGKESGRWVYAPSGAPLPASGIAPAGAGRFIVLFLRDNQAGVFAIGK
ncbi:MAG: glycosyltransferase family 39 protein [Chloroflexia bacterium]